MYENFQFVKWWWGKNDLFNRASGCFLFLWVIPCGIFAIWFGKDAILAIFIGMLALIAGCGLYGVFCVLKGMWDKFNDENPTDEVMIVRRLKGIPTPSRQEIFHD
jgi:uncharacterized protein YneF (UPF0154 family)